jgi:ATP-binding cassette subfamily B multidrug efflux pump
MLRRFEFLLDPTALAPDAPPVAGLMRFYWHYIRQAR